MSITLRMRLHPSQAGPLVVAAGRLDGSTVETLLNVVAAALSIRGARALTLDLARVTYVDVAGVVGLLQCRRRARQAGIGFAIAGVSAQVLTGLRHCQAAHLLTAKARIPLGGRCLTGRTVQVSQPEPRTRRCHAQPPR